MYNLLMCYFVCIKNVSTSCCDKNVGIFVRTMVITLLQSILPFTIRFQSHIIS